MFCNVIIGNLRLSWTIELFQIFSLAQMLLFCIVIISSDQKSSSWCLQSVCLSALDDLIWSNLISSPQPCVPCPPAGRAVGSCRRDVKPSCISWPRAGSTTCWTCCGRGVRSHVRTMSSSQRPWRWAHAHAASWTHASVWGRTWPSWLPPLWVWFLSRLQTDTPAIGYLLKARRGEERRRWSFPLLLLLLKSYLLHDAVCHRDGFDVNLGPVTRSDWFDHRTLNIICLLWRC